MSLATGGGLLASPRPPPLMRLCFAINRKLQFWGDQYCDMINGTGGDQELWLNPAALNAR